MRETSGSWVRLVREIGKLLWRSQIAVGSLFESDCGVSGVRGVSNGDGIGFSISKGGIGLPSDTDNAACASS